MAPSTRIQRQSRLLRRAPGLGVGRWIGSARRECLDRMLITGERHLRLIREYDQVA